MNEKDKMKPMMDPIEIGSDGKETLNLHVLFHLMIIETAMGKALDYARLSDMGDRSFQQFERYIKKDFYDLRNKSFKLLERYGYDEPFSDK